MYQCRKDSDLYKIEEGGMNFGSVIQNLLTSILQVVVV